MQSILLTYTLDEFWSLPALRTLYGRLFPLQSYKASVFLFVATANMANYVSQISGTSIRRCVGARYTCVAW